MTKREVFKNSMVLIITVFLFTVISSAQSTKQLNLSG